MSAGKSDRRRAPSRQVKPEAADAGGSAHFRLVFAAVVAMTVLALALDVLLAIFCSDTDRVRAAAETCSTSYKMGFGAIVGLIGGKAT